MHLIRLWLSKSWDLTSPWKWKDITWLVIFKSLLKLWVGNCCRLLKLHWFSRRDVGRAQAVFWLQQPQWLQNACRDHSAVRREESVLPLVHSFCMQNSPCSLLPSIVLVQQLQWDSASARGWDIKTSVNIFWNVNSPEGYRVLCRMIFLTLSEGWSLWLQLCRYLYLGMTGSFPWGMQPGNIWCL